MSKGEYSQAIQQQERALALREMEAKVGPDHSDTLKSRSNLVEAYRASGRTAECSPPARADCQAKSLKEK